MTTRRTFVAALCAAPLSLFAASLPYRITMSGSMPELAPQSAFAKGGNGGNGNGGGSGGRGGSSNGGGGGNGNSGGNSGRGGRGGSSNGNSSGATGKGPTVRGGGSVLRVRHIDGISEEIRDGRYIMKDSRGRTIVNRRATSADEKRLRSLID